MIDKTISFFLIFFLINELIKIAVDTIIKTVSKSNQNGVKLIKLSNLYKK